MNMIGNMAVTALAGAVIVAMAWLFAGFEWLLNVATVLLWCGIVSGAVWLIFRLWI